jgi:hypothetical protein
MVGLTLEHRDARRIDKLRHGESGVLNARKGVIARGERRALRDRGNEGGPGRLLEGGVFGRLCACCAGLQDLEANVIPTNPGAIHPSIAYSGTSEILEGWVQKMDADRYRTGTVPPNRNL